MEIEEEHKKSGIFAIVLGIIFVIFFVLGLVPRLDYLPLFVAIIDWIYPLGLGVIFILDGIRLLKPKKKKVIGASYVLFGLIFLGLFVISCLEIEYILTLLSQIYLFFSLSALLLSSIAIIIAGVYLLLKKTKISREQITRV